MLVWYTTQFFFRRAGRRFPDNLTCAKCFIHKNLLVISIIFLCRDHHAALQFISKKYQGITVLRAKKVHLQDVLILRDTNSLFTSIKISKFEQKKEKKEMKITPLLDTLIYVTS